MGNENHSPLARKHAIPRTCYVSQQVLFSSHERVSRYPNDSFSKHDSYLRLYMDNMTRIDVFTHGSPRGFAHGKRRQAEREPIRCDRKQTGSCTLRRTSRAPPRFRKTSPLPRRGSHKAAAAQTGCMSPSECRPIGDSCSKICTTYVRCSVNDNVEEHI